MVIILTFWLPEVPFWGDAFLGQEIHTILLYFLNLIHMLYLICIYLYFDACR